MPLEDQERLLDEDERRREEEMGLPASDFNPSTRNKLPKPCIQANQTIALPNEDDFERMAKMSSTPFTGNPRFYYEQDENTCAVDIVYKSVQSSMGPPLPPSTASCDTYSQPERPGLETIAETSREYYKSSSSSSG